MNKLYLIGSCQQVVMITNRSNRSTACFALHRLISLSCVIALFVVEMSSKKKRKRSCPSAKKALKRKNSKGFHKEWAEALAASDKGSYFEQDKLLELDCLEKEQDEAVLVFSASRLKLEGKYATVCKIQNHRSPNQKNQIHKRMRHKSHWYFPPETAFEAALQDNL